MASKLAQVNAVIANVTRLLDDLPPHTDAPERPLLLVFGDHGMTHGGDHGGDSAAETDSALFAFAPSPSALELARDLRVDFRRARQLLGVRSILMIDVVSFASILLFVLFCSVLLIENGLQNGSMIYYVLNLLFLCLNT